MSEFKSGDWIKRTDKRTESIYQIDSIDKDLIKCNFIKNGENWRLHTTKGEIEYATPAEISAGFREGTKEFEKYWYGRSEAEEVKAMELLNDMGDDFPIENHISPNCQSRDV